MANQLFASEIANADGLPQRPFLQALLQQHQPAADLDSRLTEHLEQYLIEPARQLLTRPRKNIRTQLLQLGFDLLKSPPALDNMEDLRRLALCSQAVELLHTGSLIVDDIQDDSAVRRGGDSMHKLYGVSGALCTGNWLYFWPLRLIQALQLPVTREHQLFQLYHDTLEKGHYGQALDLSLKIDQLPQSAVLAATRTVVQLKTGSITAMALGFGALIANADDDDLACILRFGHDFGTALQSFDDAGNILGQNEPRKRYEDLIQRKPTAVWGFAATACTAAAFNAFREHVQNIEPCVVHSDSSARALVDLHQWFEEQNFWTHYFAAARQQLEHSYAQLAARFDERSPVAMQQLRALGEMLIHAYC